MNEPKRKGPPPRPCAPCCRNLPKQVGDVTPTTCLCPASRQSARRQEERLPFHTHWFTTCTHDASRTRQGNSKNGDGRARPEGPGERPVLCFRPTRRGEVVLGVTACPLSESDAGCSPRVVPCASGHAQRAHSRAPRWRGQWRFGATSRRSGEASRCCKRSPNRACAARGFAAGAAPSRRGSARLGAARRIAPPVIRRAEGRPRRARTTRPRTRGRRSPAGRRPSRRCPRSAPGARALRRSPPPRRLWRCRPAW